MDERTARFYGLMLKLVGSFIGPGFAAAIGWWLFWCIVVIEAIAVVPLAIREYRERANRPDSHSHVWRCCKSAFSAVFLVITLNMGLNVVALSAIAYFDPARDG